MTSTFATLRCGPFGRWIIIQATQPNTAWSGSRWVLIEGNIQISNFATEQEAREHAKSLGFIIQ